MFERLQRYLRRGPRLAASRAGVTSLIVIQGGLWIAFALESRRHAGHTVLLVLGALVLGWLALTLVYRARSTALAVWDLAFGVASLVSSLVFLFTYAYWNHGTIANFNHPLTHLDAVYFALGTLSTAGTGNLAAVSETSRGYQSLEMALGMLILLLVAGSFVARLMGEELEHESRSSHGRGD